ncbi:hypothetical protein L21_0616 [Methanoculleus chikugoensis]|uniref:Uncharacterized protein n=1 Tax=Methanoculleus chikugoensis TaxID=118126 RepID=A0A1M4MIN5_9EURY|nr:hypothetical protein [Methanoculleus chikugoensis]SCL74733.1 hypothetical protein L21_0616 [Methanoculleus chikugoensis]
MMKIASAVFLLIVSVCIAGCCTDETADPAPPGGTQETPAQQYPEINVSEIPVATPELIRTNGSYIAGIALGDERARVLVRHGGKPESVAVLFHSCPRNDPYCNRNPSLIIRYGEIRFAVTVDETAGTVLGGSALVPNTPSRTYYKTRDLSTGTDTVYLGDAPIMTYNGTSLLYLNESYGCSSGRAEDLSDLDGIVARYRAAHPSGDTGTGPTREPCEDYSKTGEFIETVGGLFDLVREDPAAGRLLSDGGEIAGVVVVCPPSAASEPGGPGCYPAVRVRYGEMTIDYLVNIDCMCIERTTVEVPPGYLSRTVDNVTYIIHDGDVVLAL